ncbi:MAG: hypothetical protein ACK4R9_05835 [Ignavibacterium sp.]
MITKTFFTFIIFITLFNKSILSQYSFKIDKQGAGKPVIFIPGLISSRDVWRETVNKL